VRRLLALELNDISEALNGHRDLPRAGVIVLFPVDDFECSLVAGDSVLEAVISGVISDIVYEPVRDRLENRIKELLFYIRVGGQTFN